jgi:hypothetical protein
MTYVRLMQTKERKTQMLLKEAVSRLGLEPRALALKDQTHGF